MSNPRARALADRIEQGANALATFAEGLSDAEWNTAVPGDGRSVGVTVHHVANMYPIEVELAQVLASGKAIEGVTWAAIADMNAVERLIGPQSVLAKSFDLDTLGKAVSAELRRRVSSY